MPTDGADSWKTKYFTSLEGIESKERALKDVEEVLRLASSRLTLTADCWTRFLPGRSDRARGGDKRETHHRRKAGSVAGDTEQYQLIAILRSRAEAEKAELKVFLVS